MEENLAVSTDAQSSATESTSTPSCTSTRNERRPPAEIGGPPGPEPTRYGDWEKQGRCIDF
jgi:hypothetical protein